MKKYLFSCALLSLLLLSACGDGERIDQHQGVPVPQGVQIVSVRNIAGGAVVKVAIPDDPNLKGISATYERNGSVVETRCSRYSDSLVLVGYADTQEHKVEVRSFNVNEQYSEPATATFTPLTPAILKSHVRLKETFGGLRVYLGGNEDREDLALVLLIDDDVTDIDKPDSERHWKDLDALFTNMDTTVLARRGVEAKTALFGCYIRDRWGNRSETTVAELTPMFEQKLDRTKFSDAKMDGDNCLDDATGKYPFSGLWDGTGDSKVNCFWASKSDSPMPQWRTIDLGVTAKISRIGKYARINYIIWTGAHPRIFRFYGALERPLETASNKPTTVDQMEDFGWIYLGEYEQGKPSGYAPDGSVGTRTTEDNDYFNTGTEWEMDVDKYPDANNPIRYLRLVIMANFDTYVSHAKTGQTQLGEIIPYGEVIK